MAGYNHYTPLSDGSYRRSTVQEQPRRQPPRPAPPQQQNPQPPAPPPPPKPEPEPVCIHPAPVPPAPEDSILSFLKGLLPRQIDAADLLVISLLLLMNREEGADGMSPLLTIALYFLL